MQKLAVVYFLNTDLSKIDDFRERYDPNWNIINSHITLVSPLDGIPEDQLCELISSVVNSVRSFPIRLSGLTKSFDDYLFLLVKEGDKSIIALHDKLYSGILTPYLRGNILFTPHITLGYFGTKNNNPNGQIFEKAYAEAREMDINVNCIFDNVNLVQGDGLTPATIIKTFNLG